MPIVIVLLLTASCARVPWPEPPFGFGGSGSLALTAFAFLLPIGGAIVLSRWAASSLQLNPNRRSEVANRYSRYRRNLGYLNVFVGILAVVGLGWGWTVWNRMLVPSSHGSVLLPFGELFVPAPYILSIFTAWLVHFDAERAFHDSRSSGDSFWSRGGHFLFNLRPYAFLILLPVLFFASQQTFTRFAPETADSTAVQVLSFAMVPLLFVGLPLLIRPALGLKPMPAGPTRDRLEELARKLRFRYTNLLLWPTRGAVANAMVVGVIPWARYVVFTDRLLESLTPEQVDAVFGHEVGHVKHSHIPFYALFFILSALAVAAVVSLALSGLASSGWIDADAWEPWAGLPTLGVLLGYVFVVFGYVSRKCERQADIYGCRAASGEAVTRTGIEAMIGALERVADLNGMDSGPDEGLSRWKRAWALFRAWQHGSIRERIGFLNLLAGQPEIEPSIHRRIFRMRCVLIVLLVATIATAIAIVGWPRLSSSM